MGQVLHGSATTTEAVRRAIQHSQESLRVLAKRYGINEKTVAKWKRRDSVTDIPTPAVPRARWNHCKRPCNALRLLNRGVGRSSVFGGLATDTCVSSRLSRLLGEP